MPDPKRNWEAIRREFMAEPIKDERDRIIRGLMTQWELAERTGNDGLATLFQGAVRLILEAAPDA